MVVISKAHLVEFGAQFPDAWPALYKWYIETKKANWKNFSDVKRSFNATDAVGNDRYVFNIKGNQYRLVVLIIFKVRTVFILFEGSHSMYDKVNVKELMFKK